MTAYERPTQEPSADITHRLTNHPPGSPAVSEKLDAATTHFLWMGAWIEEFVPSGREQSLALTKLEEMSMWTKAGIARNQED